MVREVELAENSNLVNEVIGFVNSGLLLSSVKQVVLENAQIADLDAAKKYAWVQVYGEESFTWSDLRSEKMSEVWDMVYGGAKNILRWVLNYPNFWMS